MTETQRLLSEIEAFLKRTGMNASTFGHKTARDGKLVMRLRRGRTVTLQTASAIRAFMSQFAPSTGSRQKKAA